MNTNAVANSMHPLPMSPPLSMSSMSGSDRASPICSLSPTNSMTNFPFSEQNNSTYNVTSNGIYTTNSLHITPPASPPAILSVSPPSTPNTILSNVSKNSGVSNADKPRLPIFNQITVNHDDFVNYL